MKTVDEDKMKFWITCPQCKKTFGVDAAVVFKYIDRLLGQFEERFKKIGKDVNKGEPE